MIQNSLRFDKFCIIREENVELQKFFLNVSIKNEKFTTQLNECNSEILDETFQCEVTNDTDQLGVTIFLTSEQNECICENVCQIKLNQITQAQEQSLELFKNEQKIVTVKFEYFVEQIQEQNEEQEEEQQHIDQQIDQEFYQDEDPVQNDEQEVQECEEQNQEEDIDQTKNQNEAPIQSEQKRKTKNKKSKKTKKIKTKQKQDFVLHGLTNEKMREYDGLKDENLQSFFYSNDKKKHLQKMGLITRKGYIIEKPDEYLRRKEFYKKVKQEQKLFKKQQKKLQTKIKDPYKENVQTELEKQYLTGKKVQKKKDTELKQNTNMV